MGQATVELPDPLESPPPKASIGADDLLAQMAGDEIDRLLAEAEAETPSFEQQPTAPVFDDRQGPPAAQPDGFGFAEDAPRSVEAPAATARASDESVLAGELDSLLESLTTASPRPADLAPAPVAPIVQAIEAEEAAANPATGSSEAATGEAAALLSAVADEVVASGELASPAAEETTSAERSALTAEPAADASGAAGEPSTVADAAAPSPEIGQTAPLSFLLRPLEWINAPMESCPDLLREFIGKAALLTVVNAAAIIFYVRFIRRH